MVGGGRRVVLAAVAVGVGVEVVVVGAVEVEPVVPGVGGARAVAGRRRVHQRVVDAVVAGGRGRDPVGRRGALRLIRALPDVHRRHVAVAVRVVVVFAAAVEVDAVVPSLAGLAGRARVHRGLSVVAVVAAAQLGAIVVARTPGLQHLPGEGAPGRVVFGAEAVPVAIVVAEAVAVLVGAVVPGLGHARVDGGADEAARVGQARAGDRDRVGVVVADEGADVGQLRALLRRAAEVGAVHAVVPLLIEGAVPVVDELVQRGHPVAVPVELVVGVAGAVLVDAVVGPVVGPWVDVRGAEGGEHAAAVGVPGHVELVGRQQVRGAGVEDVDRQRIHEEVDRGVVPAVVKQAAGVFDVDGAVGAVGVVAGVPVAVAVGVAVVVARAEPAVVVRVIVVGLGPIRIRVGRGVEIVAVLEGVRGGRVVLAEGLQLGLAEGSRVRVLRAAGARHEGPAVEVLVAVVQHAVVVRVDAGAVLIGAVVGDVALMARVDVGGVEARLVLARVFQLGAVDAVVAGAAVPARLEGGVLAVAVLVELPCAIAILVDVVIERIRRGGGVDLARQRLGEGLRPGAVRAGHHDEGPALRVVGEVVGVHRAVAHHVVGGVPAVGPEVQGAGARDAEGVDPDVLLRHEPIAVGVEVVVARAVRVDAVVPGVRGTRVDVRSAQAGDRALLPLPAVPVGGGDAVAVEIDRLPLRAAAHQQRDDHGGGQQRAAREQGRGREQSAHGGLLRRGRRSRPGG